MAVKDYPAAVDMLEASRVHAGQHHVTSLNIGICLRMSDDLEGALRMFDDSLRLLPDYAEAKVWRNKVLKALEREEAASEAGQPADADVPSAALSSAASAVRAISDGAEDLDAQDAADNRTI